METVSKDQVVSYLQGLPEREFAQLFYTAVKGRDLYAEEADYLKTHYVLAQASTTLGEDGKWEPYEVEFLALKNDEKYSGKIFAHGDFCQFGKCSQCNNKVVSWAKYQICPICNNEAYGT